MNEKLEQQLQADFPFMVTNKVDGEENLYRRYGCDCDDGWYGLIHDMCQAISKRYAEDGLPVDLIPTQLKEKYATLRFYYTFEGAQGGSAAIDLPGGQNLRLEPENGAPRDERKELLWRDVAQIVRVYEAKSSAVCEAQMGHPSVRTSAGGELSARTAMRSGSRKRQGRATDGPPLR